MTEKITLNEILARRDQRAMEIAAMLSEAPDHQVLSFSLNIPGPDKTSPELRKIALRACQEAEKYYRFKGYELSELRYLDLKTGPEFMALVKGDGEVIKSLAIELEENSCLGRLYDLDVTGQAGLISRKDLGLKPRTCLICDQPAQVCARSRRHSLAELDSAVSALIELCVNMLGDNLSVS